MKNYKEADILRKKFFCLLERRAYKILDTLSSHITKKSFHRTKNKEIKTVQSLPDLIYIIREMLFHLKKYYPYNKIEDWSDKPVILVDIDSTLFEREGDPCYGNHCFGDPILHVIEVVNELYDYGCMIKIFTGRMNLYLIEKDKSVKHTLKKALRDAGVKYHEILELQKPNADAILDDLAINPLI